MNQTLQLHQLHFEPFITAATIQKRVAEIGRELSNAFQNEPPLLIAILNGSFMFTADLVRHCTFDHEISFIKLASYKGTQSTGTLITAIGLQEDFENRDIIIIEDIVDTGNTLYQFLPQLRAKNPASLTVVTLLLKPSALEQDIQLDYIGFEIPDKFVVGYGMDYDGLGRNLPDLYQKIG